MRTRRTLKLALAVAAALLAAGTTFAWAGVLVGGHRADQIGTFEPVAHRLVPAGTQVTPVTAPQSRPTTTSPSLATTSLGEVTKPTTAVSATTGRHSDNPTSPTTDDNGRSNDD